MMRPKWSEKGKSKPGLFRRLGTWFRGVEAKCTLTVLIGSLVLFAMFYPLESGLPVLRSYAQCLRWFKWYNF